MMQDPITPALSRKDTAWLRWLATTEDRLRELDRLEDEARRARKAKYTSRYPRPQVA